MSEVFDSINIEIYNTSWVDVTHDVKANPRPRWNRGIMSNKPQDRIGHAGIFTFTLNNSISNSAGLSGYYSPGHANCWAGWTTGLPVRLSFTFEGIKYYKYYGRIKPDGLDVEAGIYGARTVAITCGDWMWVAGQHELKTMTFAQNKRIDELVGLVSDNMPFHPLAEDFDVGVETFPTIFDMLTTRTIAMSEYYKAAMSEWGYIYVKGDLTGGETLVVENQTSRTSATAKGKLSIPASASHPITDESDANITDENDVTILADEVQDASFDGLMSEGMQVSYGKTQTNRVNSSAYPRRVDAAATTVLWKLEKSFKINAGETITGYRGQYRDPSNPNTRVSGISMAAMVSGTDYIASANEDGSGANLTANLTATPAFGTEAVIFTLTASATLWVQTLQVKGKGVYTDTTIQSVIEDTVSQAIHGVIPLSLDFKYQADARKAQTYCAYVISTEALPKKNVDACPMWANAGISRMMGFLQLEPGMKAEFIESQTATSAEYFIQGYSAEICPGGYVLWNPVLKDDPGFFDFAIWDVNAWDAGLWG
jgi:hypothetical protein